MYKMSLAGGDVKGGPGGGGESRMEKWQRKQKILREATCFPTKEVDGKLVCAECGVVATDNTTIHNFECTYSYSNLFPCAQKGGRRLRKSRKGRKSRRRYTRRR